MGIAVDELTGAEEVEPRKLAGALRDAFCEHAGDRRMTSVLCRERVRNARVRRSAMDDDHSFVLRRARRSLRPGESSSLRSGGPGCRGSSDASATMAPPSASASRESGSLTWISRACCSSGSARAAARHLSALALTQVGSPPKLWPRRTAPMQSKTWRSPWREGVPSVMETKFSHLRGDFRRDPRKMRPSTDETGAGRPADVPDS